MLPKEILANEGKHLDPDGAYMALVASRDDVEIVGASERLDDLQAVDGTDEGLASYRTRFGLCGVREFSTATATIFQLAIETFPRHVNNVYFVRAVHDEKPFRLLLDAGSGLDSSRRDLALAFAILRHAFAESARWEDLDWCLVSHAHIDHFGGVNALKQTSRAKIAAHELDARVLSGFDERLAQVAKQFDLYWRRAGVPVEQRTFLRDMYLAEKSLFRSEAVDRVLHDGDTIGPGFVVHHVPGHCPGLLCVQIGDVLLTSDHVLARITPHQFPQSIMPFAGLAHYLRSLAKIRALPGITVALGGHEEPIRDLRARIDEIEAFHRGRLARVLEICATPHTIVEIANVLFGERHGYDVILALDEAGAHVEYLHEVGQLRAESLEAAAGEDEPVVSYVAQTGASAPVA